MKRFAFPYAVIAIALAVPAFAQEVPSDVVGTVKLGNTTLVFVRGISARVRSMSELTSDQWKQTACILCYVNCGVELGVEGRRIVRVRGDKAHPRSRGYLCQKAQRLHFYGEHADRLRTPLRRSASTQTNLKNSRDVICAVSSSAIWGWPRK